MSTFEVVPLKLHIPTWFCVLRFFSSPVKETGCLPGFFPLPRGPAKAPESLAELQGKSCSALLGRAFPIHKTQILNSKSLVPRKTLGLSCGFSQPRICAKHRQSAVRMVKCLELLPQIKKRLVTQNDGGTTRVVRLMETQYILLQCILPLEPLDENWCGHLDPDMKPNGFLGLVFPPPLKAEQKEETRAKSERTPGRGVAFRCWCLTLRPVQWPLAVRTTECLGEASKFEPKCVQGADTCTKSSTKTADLHKMECHES